MSTFEVILRDGPDQEIEADYLEYERGDAVLYKYDTRSDRDIELGRANRLKVAIIPSAAYLLVRKKETVKTDKEEFITQLRRFGVTQHTNCGINYQDSYEKLKKAIVQFTKDYLDRGLPDEVSGILGLNDIEGFRVRWNNSEEYPFATDYAVRGDI